MVYTHTPYFIFLRDTVSYLVLLALHCAVCLAPSTVPFTELEVVIIVFFLGRITLELQQLVSAKYTQTGLFMQSCLGLKKIISHFR